MWGFALGVVALILVVCSLAFVARQIDRDPTKAKDLPTKRALMDRAKRLGLDWDSVNAFGLAMIKDEEARTGEFYAGDRFKRTMRFFIKIHLDDVEKEQAGR